MSRRRWGRPVAAAVAATGVLGLLLVPLTVPAAAGGAAEEGDAEVTTITTPPTTAAGTGLGTIEPVTPDLQQATEVYRRVDGQELRAHVRRPAGGEAAERPVVVLLHGGGWYSGSAEDMTPWADLLVDAGWVTVALDHRLASETRPAWPEAFEDVQAGVAWTHANAERLGADPERLAVFGVSAGGHLAALLAVQGAPLEEGGGDVPIRAVAAWSPPLDLAPLAVGPDGRVPACRGNRECQVFWSLGVVEWFLGCRPEACPDDYAAASPVGQVDGATRPLWVANATSELTPIAPARAMAAALAGAGVEHRLVVVPGVAHAHGYGQAVWNDMVPWLADRLEVPRPDPAPFPAPDDDRTRPLLVALGAGAGALTLGLVVAARHHRLTRESAP